ncbi:lactonase family protein [Draconibacterium sp. IB214405]|uniref:lactonase family protein n=1 Tax=Draconibacterium sp. IB214405 TaxID=3097352 RepID=UPI002A0F2056|nr:lactonase family protein [Draconibacterium sp. IB214405]MDX8341196.1 lactonase family protein [Draconibacterium sp. IB214405]
MLRNILFSCLLIFLIVATGSAQEKQLFYVGTFTSEGSEGINYCSLNTETGAIELLTTFKGIDNPSFLRLSPDKQFLYTVSRTTPEVEPSGGYVVAYKLDEWGGLHFLNKQVSHGSGPCHIDVSPDRKYVAIATYGGGTTSVYPVKEDGSIDKALTTIRNTGKSVHPNQTQPHAHSIKFAATEPSIFSADLGTDQLNIFHFEDGNLGRYEQEFVKLPAGSGPRHFVFHPTEKVIYVINELNSTVSCIRKVDDSWSIFQNISTLPKDFDGESYCADIHFSKDGQYLYGSNRGHNSIAVFKVNPDQKLTFLGTVPVEGDWPRNFGITPDGKWMLVANQRSHNITVFKMNAETGMPEFSGKQIQLPAPVCIEFL